MNVTGKLLRAVAALVLLALVIMFVLSYWGNYRAATTSSAETTQTAEPAGDAEEDAEAAEPGQTVVVLTDGLNFRQKPARDGKLIDGLKKGDELTYLGTEGDWYKVRTSDGTEGYVTSSDKYTKLQ